MKLKRSIGQWNFHSKLNEDGTSIVKRSASRSLTGRGLHIHIHQHIGYRFHLVCDTTSSGKETSMCIESVFNVWWIFRFFETLMSEAFEGVCDCACTNVSEWLKDKVESCQVAITTQSQKIRYCPRSCLRTLQETEKYKRFRCTCRVSSSHAVFLDKNLRTSHLRIIYITWCQLALYLNKQNTM